jgi:hypothetical protein
LKKTSEASAPGAAGAVVGVEADAELDGAGVDEAVGETEAVAAETCDGGAVVGEDRIRASDGAVDEDDSSQRHCQPHGGRQMSLWLNNICYGMA